MPIKYAVPAGSARTRVLTALAARYTGGTVRGWDVLDGLDTHPASQNSGRFGYSFGKTRRVDIMQETAQVVLLNGNLWQIPRAIDIAQEGITRNRQNWDLLFSSNTAAIAL